MADRDFLEEIREAEAEAALLVEEARAKSQEKRHAVRQEAADLIQAAHSQAASVRQESLARAEKKARQILENQESSEGQALRPLSQESLNQAANILAERILSILEHR
ncbi:MAG: hypothetical protein WDA02_05355 [Saccharofermentanales bacterium]